MEAEQDTVGYFQEGNESEQGREQEQQLEREKEPSEPPPTLHKRWAFCVRPQNDFVTRSHRMLLWLKRGLSPIDLCI